MKKEKAEAGVKGWTEEDSKEFFGLNRPKPPPGEVWGPKEWYPSRVRNLDRDIIHFALANKMSSEDFIKYFRKDIAPDLDTEIQKQAEALEKSRQEFDEKKKIEALPENKILSCYFGRRAYPKPFEEITKQYSLEDFIKVRNLVVGGQLDHKLAEAGTDKTQFLTWLNTMISQKQESQNVSNEVKETQHALKRLIHLFRGH